MAVDSVLHRGYYVTRVPRSTLWIYDLERLRPIASIATDLPAGPVAVDDVHHRLYFAPSQPPINCRDSLMFIFDEVRLKFQQNQIPCETNTGTGFFTRGLAYSASADKLYAIGAASVAATATLVTGLSNQHEQIIVRQMTLNADTFDLDWEIDATGLCDSVTNDPVAPEPVIGRAATGVMSYCYQNGQGRAVWIPLRGNEPVLDATGRPTVNVSPTIGRVTVPVVDQAGNRILIFEDKRPFGPAVYVYDPEHERFLGVIPSGVPPEQNGTFYDYWRGLDATAGKAYILNQAGLVVADVRATPLPPGTAYPIMTGGVNQVFSGPISVDGRLHRLFFAYPQRGGFVVVEDHEPRVAPVAVDPDAGTADIAEQAGVTDRTFSGEATAFGAHILNTGGIPRVVDNFDVLCTATTTVNDRDQYGRCPADQVVTSGNRETLFAASTLQAGDDTGAVASAFLQTNPAADEATDRDVRTVGRCGSDAVRDRGVTQPAPCPNGSGQPLADASAGTAGAAGKGYPVPGALCEDFAGTAAHDDATVAPAGRAHAQCDTTAHVVGANATMAAFTTDGLPLTVSVAQTTSDVTSKLTGSGLVSTATATAHGVTIVDPSRADVVSIGSITTTATTVTRGRRGTAQTAFAITFADVRAPGLACVACDPAAVTAVINRVLGASVRARSIAPQVVATPRGYRALVGKEPALAASDRAVNDDDSVTATGLDLIFYNDSAPTNRDGSAGRSRVVISLAGVQAESRYGIFRLPVAAAIDGTPLVAGSGVPISVLGSESNVGIAPAVDRAGASVASPSAAPRGVTRRITHTLAVAVQRPRDLLLMAATWALFLAPLYFVWRRRARAKVLAS